MQKVGDTITLSASDLVGHLNCQHLTRLDIAFASGTLQKPKEWDLLLELLWERGAKHEEAYVDHLMSQGFNITEIEGIGVNKTSVAQTRDAIASGSEIIVL